MSKQPRSQFVVLNESLVKEWSMPRLVAKTRLTSRCDDHAVGTSADDSVFMNIGLQDLRTPQQNDTVVACGALVVVVWAFVSHLEGLATARICCPLRPFNTPHNV